MALTLGSTFNSSGASTSSITSAESSSDISKPVNSTYSQRSALRNNNKNQQHENGGGAGVNGQSSSKPGPPQQQQQTFRTRNKTVRRRAAQGSAPMSILELQQQRQLPSQQPPSSSLSFGEVIETHFIREDAIFFVIYNAHVGEAHIAQRRISAEIAYSVRPLWYVAGTPALSNYVKKMKPVYKAYITDADIEKPNAYVPKSLQRFSYAYLGNLKRPANHPHLDVGNPKGFMLNIPSNWGQLAHYRLLHHNIDRITAVGLLPTKENGQDEDENNDDDDKPAETAVYVVYWQNERAAELVPTEYLHTYTRHSHHHEVALQFWEGASVQDSRKFRSAATVDFSLQKDEYGVDGGEEYWIKCAHEFEGRRMWTTESGKPSKAAKCKMYVHRWVGWPMNACVVEDVPADHENDKPENSHSKSIVNNEVDEVENPTDPDVGVLDEYVDVRIYDKFVPNAVTGKFEGSSLAMVPDTPEFKRKTKSTSHLAHVPPSWRELGEKLADSNDSVTILATFEQSSLAIVYVVRWPNYLHLTLVTSLTLRKRHARAMLDFLQQNAFLSPLEFSKPPLGKTR